MGVLLKSSGNIMKSGSNVLRFGKTAQLAAIYSPITAANGNLNGPFGVAVDNTNNRLFIVNNANGTLSYVSLTSPYAGYTMVTNPTPDFTNVIGVWVDPPTTTYPRGRLFTTGNALIHIFHLDTLTLSSYINFSGSLAGMTGEQPSTAFPNGRLLFCDRTNSVIKIYQWNSPTTLLQIVTTAQGTFDTPYGVELDPVGQQIIVSNYNSSLVNVIPYLNPTSTISSIANLGRSFCIVDSNNNAAYFPNNNTQTMSIASLSNLAGGAIGSVTQAQGGFSNCFSGAIDKVNGKIYVANYGSNTISIISNVIS
jgi:DNA-binding beta-propeller fold protein YncE